MSDKLFKTGILSDTEIAELFNAKIINVSEKLINDQIQPASLDLRLGKKAWRVRSSFLPGSKNKVKSKISRLSMHEIDLSKGAVLEKGCVYIAEIMENLDYFITLMKSSSVDKRQFMTQGNQTFFVDLIDNLTEKDNIVRLTFLEFDNTKVASSLSFVMNNTRYLYNSGYDQKFSDLSVGLINHAYSIKLSIEENLQFFDFMRGNERYKYHLGSLDSKLYTINGKRK